MINLAVLGSTRGSNLLPLLAASQDGSMDARLKLVISNKQDAPILEKALKHGIPSHFLNPAGLSRENYDEKISELLRAYSIDLLVLSGYMRILSAKFVRAWPNRIMNVHPSLLPEFSGLMDLDVHRAVLAAGKSYSGCTVHYVTEEVDEGPIICQLKCPVLPDDTPEDLKTRLQALEAKALIKAINAHSQNRISLPADELLCYT
ncbi:phosphoribosylglycinamide formyltransferase [Legionella birminghamensis]|uniref:Phosphoribosylglycinamide formyltransferase n=1 Tax=Legionella birminghamensis TaxID=28083 RepID=A0A378I889_9GAMM|nr:phosphoribosylglycinamide formyltransferase [Legionella birminghamensis]KTC68028.1 phosphoribosylglycinamide formyltransferase [Legionella birminghamensis]STX31263.1 phosphoribosylglycinamide formyltransferase 1 [Legionella birminghamensis]